MCPEKRSGADTARLLAVFFASLAAALAVGLVVILYQRNRGRSAAPRQALSVPSGMPVQHTFHPLGGLRCEVTVWGRDLRRFMEDAEQLEALVHLLEHRLSSWYPESAASRCNTAPVGRPISIPPELVELLSAAVRIRTMSRGAFEPFVGAGTLLWRKAAGGGRVPATDQLASVRGCCSADAFTVDAAKATCRKNTEGARLDLDGILAGYVIDKVVEKLRDRGVRAARVRVGHDVRVLGGGISRRVSVENPANPGTTYGYLTVRDGAVSSAGSYIRAFEIAGRRYSRIVDPRTLKPVPGALSATVMAPDCTTADGAATALLVVGVREGLPLVEEIPHLEVLFLLQEGSRVRQVRSSGFPELLDMTAEGEPFPSE